MNLDEGQRKTVAGWIEQGLKLSEIQNKLASELGVNMTYMDVRFLIDDLKLRPKDIEPAAPVAMAAAKQSAGATSNASAGASPSPMSKEPGAGGGVSVTVDQIARPGAAVSGRVTFSDGQGAAWLIDQMGRPGLVPDQQGYRPSQPDILDFQQKLQDELARMGF
jgi:hypothetical protein